MEPPIVPARGLSTLRARGRSLPINTGGRRLQPALDTLRGRSPHAISMLYQIPCRYRGLSEGHGTPGTTREHASCRRRLTVWPSPSGRSLRSFNCSRPVALPFGLRSLRHPYIRVRRHTYRRHVPPTARPPAPLSIAESSQYASARASAAASPSPQPQQGPESEPEQPPIYRMCRAVKSVRALWREWTEGLGGNPSVAALILNGAVDGGPAGRTSSNGTPYGSRLLRRSSGSRRPRGSARKRLCGRLIYSRSRCSAR
jgi:hypothetical protein